MSDSPANKEESKLPDAFIAAQWKPGQSGNPSGRPKKRLLDEVLTELLEAADSGDAIEIAKALIAKAKGGDSLSAKLVAERTQGKPMQKVEVTGENGGPLQARVAIEFVDVKSAVPE